MLERVEQHGLGDVGHNVGLRLILLPELDASLLSLLALLLLLHPDLLLGLDGMANGNLQIQGNRNHQYGFGLVINKQQAAGKAIIAAYHTLAAFLQMAAISAPE